jgi:hypothetical protein
LIFEILIFEKLILNFNGIIPEKPAGIEILFIVDVFKK